jgi:hypothetical protein
MWYELQATWFTAIFVTLGALIILLGVARLLYVRRRSFQPKDSIRTAFAPSFVETGLTPSQVVEAQQDLYRSFHRASPWIIIGAGAGVILASLAQLGLVTLIYQRITELLNISRDFDALVLVESGVISGLLFGGMAVGAGAGLLFGVGLTPRDTIRTKAPARGIFDLISPGIVVVAFAPILALLGFTSYCATNFPLRQTAEPLLETFPWLPYAGPAVMASAFVLAHLCILVLCRMKPRQWTHEESRAEWADR